MSAQFFLHLRGRPVRVVELSPRRIYELVAPASATPFTSEADAWWTAFQLELTPEQVTVRSAQKEAA